MKNTLNICLLSICFSAFGQNPVTITDHHVTTNMFAKVNPDTSFLVVSYVPLGYTVFDPSYPFANEIYWIDGDKNSTLLGGLPAPFDGEGTPRLIQWMDNQLHIFGTVRDGQNELFLYQIAYDPFTEEVDLLYQQSFGKLGEGIYFYDIKYFNVNDTAVGVTGAYQAPDSLGGNVSGQKFWLFDKTGLIKQSFYLNKNEALQSALVHNNTISFKSLNYTIWTLDSTFSVRNITTRQYLNSYPNGDVTNNPFTNTNRYYAYGGYLGADEFGNVEPSWVDANRPFDLFMFVYDSTYTMINKVEYEERDDFTDMKIQRKQSKLFSFIDTNQIMVAYTSFSDPNHGNEFFPTFEHVENSSLTVQVNDTLGNILCKQRYFEEDDKNHVAEFVIPYEEEVLIVNYVVDINEYPEKYINTELMWVDKTCKVLGIQTINDPLKKATLFPNPAHEKVRLEWDAVHLSASEISIYNLQGQLMQNASVPNQNVALLDVSQLPAGQYLVTIQQQNGERFGASLIIK